MVHFFQFLGPLQIFFKPGLILLLIWACYRTVFKQDRAVGLVLYISLIIITDTFYDTGIYIPGMEQGSIKYSEIICLFLLFHSAKIEPPKNMNKFVFFLVFVFLSLVFYSALRGYTLKNGMNNYRRHFVPAILTIWVAYKGFRTQEDYNRFLFYFMILIVILGLFTFWDVIFDQWLLHSDGLHKSVYISGRRHGRFGSLFLNPNHMGGFCVLMLPVMFVITTKQKTFLKKLFCRGSFLLFLFAFIKTGSRGPMLGFAVAMLFFVLIPIKRYPFRRKIGTVAITLLVLSLLMPNFFRAATGRFEILNKEMDPGEVDRYTVWEFTIKNLIPDYPFFGIGLGEPQYIVTMHKYGFADIYGYTLHNPHSSYLQIAVMSGCIALFVFFWINGLVIFRNVSFIRKYEDHDLSPILLSMTAGLVGFLTCLVMDMQLFTNVADVYWLVLFLSHAISSSLQPDPPETLIQRVN